MKIEKSKLSREEYTYTVIAWSVVTHSFCRVFQFTFTILVFVYVNVI